MHKTAYDIGGHFLQLYGHANQVIVELGSYDVNGSLRDFCPQGALYLGLDLEYGPNVDILVEREKPLPLKDDFADIIVTSSCFEHDPMFWETFLDLARVLKPGGFLYVNAPSNGAFHRYPVDCWRFYPDSGRALERLAQKKGYSLALVESFVSARTVGDQWNDFVAVFQKAPHSALESTPFISDLVPCKNVIRKGEEHILKHENASEDMLIILSLENEIKEMKRMAAEHERAPPLPPVSPQQRPVETGGFDAIAAAAQFRSEILELREALARLNADD